MSRKLKILFKKAKQKNVIIIMKTICQLISQARIWCIIGFLILLSCFNSNSQTSSLLRQVIQPSPTVASLGKFAEIPVGYYTGTPNISVPIYEATSGQLKLPISLNYHASGVRVEEVASSVGLSWALQAGGVITRLVRGLPDENSYWASTPVQNRIETIMNSGNYNELLYDIENGSVDGEADIYYFNFAGRSGKFIFDQSGGVQIVPKSNLLVQSYGTGWKIVDELGTQYAFQKTETVSSSSCIGDNITTSSWFLTSIISADSKRSINCTYEDLVFDYPVLIGETKYFSIDGTGSLCMPNPPPCVGTQAYVTQRLTRIDFETGYIKFNYYTDRCDLWNDKMLDEIAIYTIDNVFLKKFTLSHSYFGGSANCNFNNTVLKRLKLDAITESTYSETKPSWVFTYDESAPLPSRLSYSQDHWGYYNGATNSTMIGGFSTVVWSGDMIFFPGANRSTNPDFAQIGIMQKIKYPTGGETNFTYESNSVNDSRLEPLYEDRYLSYSVSNYPVLNLPNPLSVTPMVIPPGGAQVEFVNVTGLESTWYLCDISELWVTKNGQRFLQIGNSQQGGFFFWDEGTYSLELDTECGVDAIATFNVMIKAKIPTTPPSDDFRYVGGLRVSRIEDVPGEGGLPIVREFSYVQQVDTTKSSGVLVNFPLYESDLSVYSWETDSWGSPVGPGHYCTYRVRSATSKFPLATTSGSYVGYSFVKEILPNGGENHFSFIAYEEPSPQLPFAPVEAYDWRRGFLTNVKSYSKVNGQLSLVKEIVNTPAEFNETRVYGVKVGRNFLELKNGSSNLGGMQRQSLPIHSYYPSITMFFGQGSSKERIYYDPQDLSKVLEKSIAYSYDANHFQVTQLKEVTSNATSTVIEENILNKKYAPDYIFSGVPVGTEAGGIKKLQELHIVGVPIEEYVVKQDKNLSSGQISNQRVISGSVYSFKPDNPYPDQVFNLELSEPMLLSGFGNGSALVNNSFQKNNAYKSVASFLSYDDKGNIVTQQKPNDVSETYLWGYFKSYPTARVTNVSLLNDIAFTSFEGDSDGNWTLSIPGGAGKINTESYSGTTSYQVSVSNYLSRTNLNNQKTYELSFWYKTGASIIVSGGTPTNLGTSPGVNGWLLSRWKILGATSISISGSGIIDDIRLSPEGSYMTTYTYDLLKGATSQTDPNGITTYYVYDDFGRLKLIKDEGGNILQHYQYHYKGQ